MKIYFTASVSGKQELLVNYKNIIAALEKEGHDVISDHILNIEPKDLDAETVEDRISHHGQVSKWITETDMTVAEVSNPSVSVGYEIAMALEKSKPVLALHERKKAPPALLGERSEKFILSTYNLDDLSQTIKTSIEYLIDQQDTRFNFFISPTHQNYLDWIAKNRRIPRSVFLRRLIDNHMKENEDFQKSV